MARRCNHARLMMLLVVGFLALHLTSARRSNKAAFTIEEFLDDARLLQFETLPPVGSNETDAPTASPTPLPTTAAPIATEAPTTAAPTGAPDEYETSEENTKPSDSSVELGRDPAIPYDKIASDAPSPFHDWIPDGYSKNGIVYDFTRNGTDIIDASTTLSGEATLGTYIPGRVFKEGKAMVEYYPGNTPFLFTCIHNNDNGYRPFMKNWILTKRTCRANANCYTAAAIKNFQAIADEDFDTLSKRSIRRKIYSGIAKADRPRLPLGDRIGNYCDKMYKQFITASGNKAYPHYVKTRIPMMFVDIIKDKAVKNWIRPAGSIRNSYGMTVNNPELYASYHDFNGFVREAKNVIGRQYGYGSIIDFHSHSTKRLRVDVASGHKGKTKLDFNNPTNTRSQIESGPLYRSHEYWLGFDYEERGLTPYEYFYGEHSLSEALSLRGMMAAPSRAWGYFTNNDNEAGYFRGSGFHSRVAMPTEVIATNRDRDMDNIEINNRPVESWYNESYRFNNYAIQVPIKYLRYSEGVTNVVNTIIETLLDISDQFWDLDLRDSSVTPAYTPISTLHAATTAPGSCGDMSSNVLQTITIDPLPQGFIPTQTCIETCKMLEGCNYVHLFAKHTGQRTCTLMSDCTIVSGMSYRWRQVIDMSKL